MEIYLYTTEDGKYLAWRVEDNEFFVVDYAREIDQVEAIVTAPTLAQADQWLRWMQSDAQTHANAQQGLVPWGRVLVTKFTR